MSESLPPPFLGGDKSESEFARFRRGGDASESESLRLLRGGEASESDLFFTDFLGGDASEL